MSNYAVAYRVEDGQPWMGIKGVATADDATVQEMFDAANLGGWDVHTREVHTDARTDSPDFEVIRTNPFDGGLDRLAMVKSRYTEVQNEQIRDLASNIAHGDVKPVAMGAYKGGRQVFMSFELGESIVIDPNGQADEIGRFLTIQTSHDGSLSIVSVTGNMRLRCQNMLTSNRANALGVFKIRHTQSVDGRVQDARTALSIAVRQSHIFEEDMQKLAEVQVTDDTFWSMVTDLFPKPEKDVRGSVKKWETRTDRLMDLWAGSAEGGNTVENLDKTAYRAYNALNEDLMWYTSVRAGNVENALVRASGFDENANKQNVRLYNRALALV